MSQKKQKKTYLKKFLKRILILINTTIINNRYDNKIIIIRFKLPIYFFKNSLNQ